MRQSKRDHLGAPPPPASVGGVQPLITTVRAQVRLGTLAAIGWKASVWGSCEASFHFPIPPLLSSLLVWEDTQLGKGGSRWETGGKRSTSQAGPVPVSLLLLSQLVRTGLPLPPHSCGTDEETEAWRRPDTLRNGQNWGLNLDQPLSRPPAPFPLTTCPTPNCHFHLFPPHFSFLK